MSLFGEASPEKVREVSLKEIRQAMLDCLTGLPEGDLLARVWIRVLYAPDLQALWYLRTDVMTLMCNRLGESLARERITPVTAMFKGLLPAAQTSRTSRLHG